MEIFFKNRSGSLELEKGFKKWVSRAKKWSEKGDLRVAHPRTTFQCDCPHPIALTALPTLNLTDCRGLCRLHLSLYTCTFILLYSLPHAWAGVTGGSDCDVQCANIMMRGLGFVNKFQHICSRFKMPCYIMEWNDLYGVGGTLQLSFEETDCIWTYAVILYLWRNGKQPK